MFRAQKLEREQRGERELDSEDEEGLAYDMFIDDIDQLRHVMLRAIHKVMDDQIDLEDRFDKERDFYTNQIATQEKTIRDLNIKISELEKDLLYERNQNDIIFAEQEVSLMCQKAYFSEELLK